VKHILAIVKPYPDVKGHQAPKVELDYLRIVHTVSEMRKQGEKAQGYFIVIGDQIPKQMTRWEQGYRGNQYVEMISTLPTSCIRHTARNEDSADLAGLVTAAILDKTGSPPSPDVLRNIQDYILDETILALEPRVQRIKDESRFPMGIQWDYYGVV
jgi:hypothetical protein